MDILKSFEKQIYSVNENNFEDIALAVFRVQAIHNDVYRRFLEALGVNKDKIRSLLEIPFLPISLFKTGDLKTGSWIPERVFSSSGTTGQITSRHALMSSSFYHQHAVRCFEQFFGPITGYHFFALLPSYLERSDSSLVAMMQHFITSSQSSKSGFYLNNTDQLIRDVDAVRSDNRKTIVWGVTFALLDLAEKQSVDLGHCIVFETGGMKGRRKEITRFELHQVLCEGFNVPTIYSEYGMTELLSQAYTRDGGHRFECPASMKVIGRDLYDPMEKGIFGQTSGLNVVDLANFSTISFIETEDLGKIYRDGSFEVLGRFDNADVRGCNLMVD